MSSSLSVHTRPYVLAAETGHDKEDRVLTRRRCPSLARCSLHVQLSLAFQAGQIWKVLTILTSCEEMECNNPALVAFLC